MSIVARPPDPGQPGVRTNPRPQPGNPARHFDKCPRDLRRCDHRRLSHAAFRVYAAVVYFDGMPDGCVAGNDKLAAEAGGMSVPSVKRALKELESLGQIRRHLDPSGRHRYRIDVLDAPLDAPTVVDHPRSTRKASKGVGGSPAIHKGGSPVIPHSEGVESELTLTVNDSLRTQEEEIQTPPAAAPQDPPQAPEPEPAPTPTPDPATPPAASQAPRELRFAREDFDRIKDHPELVKPAAKFIARELNDRRSIGFYRGLCRTVAEGREPVARLAHAFDAARTSTWADRLGAAFTSEWNEWRPPAAAETNEGRFIRTNWSWIVDAVHAGTARHIQAGMTIEELRERTARAADAHADQMRYLPEHKTYLRAGFLRALDEFHAKGGEPIGVTERREAEAAAKAKDREWLKTKYAAPVSGRPGRRARQPVAAMA